MAKANVAGIVGDIFSFILIVAPMETMYRIWQAKSVGERSVYNYVGTFANAVALVFFSAPTAATAGWFIAGINIAASILEFMYTCMYYKYAQGSAKRISGWAIVCELIYAGGLLIIYFAAFFGNRNEEARIIFFGVLAAVTGCVMYGAMIPDMLAIIRTHDVLQQSIILLLAAVGNTTSWIVFSAKENPLDYYVLVPNGVGILLATIQSVVWVIVWIAFRNVAPPQLPLGHAAPPQLPLGHVTLPVAGSSQQPHDNVELPVIAPLQENVEPPVVE